MYEVGGNEVMSNVCRDSVVLRSIAWDIQERREDASDGAR